ncbi:DUF4129 domain-containing protein [Actinokineospora sp. HUAS TT18]|uniref:DUF4129 domain-containing protein n=1 Tax=Actinokineospora sp. HUAS TT18 TaxID=3447451 RepID=UPI003F5273C8
MRSRLPALLVVAAMLVLAVAAARGESAIPRGGPLGAVSEPPAGPVAPPPEDIERNFFLDLLGGVTTGALLLLVLAMLLIGAAAILAGLTRRRRVARPRLAIEIAGTEGAEPGMPVVDLVEAAKSARVTLSRRAGGPPADAIVAAWLVLEDAAAARGTRRAAHETPTEFVARVVAAHGVDATGLRDLYHRARFGGAVTAGDVAAADEALARLEEKLAGARR